MTDPGVKDLQEDDVDGLLEDLDTNGTSTIAMAELARSIRQTQRDLIKAAPPPSPVSGTRPKVSDLYYK